MVTWGALIVKRQKMLSPRSLAGNLYPNTRSISSYSTSVGSHQYIQLLPKTSDQGTCRGTSAGVGVVVDSDDSDLFG
jgi:hypothetical protein